jgi:hypothetical protein
MKPYRKLWLIVVFLLNSMFMLNSVADPPIPPPPPGGHGLGGNQQGAPIDGGLGILLVLGAAYGTKKLYKRSNMEKE